MRLDPAAMFKSSVLRCSHNSKCWAHYLLLPWQTTKERHMWTCPFHPPVQLYFIIRNTEHSPDFGISHIKIWNYNRSLNVTAFSVYWDVCGQFAVSPTHASYNTPTPNPLHTDSQAHTHTDYEAARKARAHKSSTLACCHRYAGWLHLSGYVTAMALLLQLRHWLAELPVTLSKCRTVRD